MRDYSPPGFWHNSSCMLSNRLASRSFIFVCVIVSALISAQAQQTVVPTITFTCDFPGSEPDHYVISVAEDGAATYDSTSKLSSESDAEDSFHSEFTISQAARIRVFDLAKRSHYFEGDIDTKNKKLASTGTKVLGYKDAQKSTRATYNYSPVPSVQELTTFFQGLSTTLEFGHRIGYDLRYQKLALDDELKKMEEMLHSGGLEEISAVAPVLQKIVDDPAVMNIARGRAQRLLQAAGSPGK
jgi:hypothetical protein